MVDLNKTVGKKCMVTSWSLGTKFLRTPEVVSEMSRVNANVIAQFRLELVVRTLLNFTGYYTRDHDKHLIFSRILYISKAYDQYTAGWLWLTCF